MPAIKAPQPAIFVLFRDGNKAFGRVGPMPEPPETTTTIAMAAPPAWRGRTIERPAEGEVFDLDAASGAVSRQGVIVGHVTRTALDGLRRAIGLPASKRETKKPKPHNVKHPNNATHKRVMKSGFAKPEPLASIRKSR